MYSCALQTYALWFKLIRHQQLVQDETIHGTIYDADMYNTDRFKTHDILKTVVTDKPNILK